MTNSFTINQSLTLRELLSASFYIFMRIKAFQRFLLFILIIVVLSNVLGLLSTSKHDRMQSIIEIMGAPIIMTAIFGGLILISGTAMFFLKPANFRNVTYHFSPSGMVKTANGVKVSVPWRNFLKLKETPSFFLLYISSFDAHIISKRVFTDHAEMEAFKELVRASTGDWLRDA